MTIITLLSGLYTPASGPISIVFGSPKRNCAGHGVCRLEISKPIIARLRRPCPAFPVRLRYDADLLKLGFQIHRADLTDAVWEKQFKQGVFVVEAPYSVRRSVTKVLNLSRTITIKPGRYPFTRKGSIVTCYLDTEKARISHRAIRTQPVHS